MPLIKRVAWIVGFLLLLPHGARADAIAVGDAVTFGRGIGNTGGGEIIVTANDDPTTAFVSFCMQAGVGGENDFNTTMFVAGISDYANYQPENQGGDPYGRDYLTLQTAWLYTQFRNDALEGFDGSDTAVDALQYAIWQLQGERGIPEADAAAGLANSFIALSNDAVANGVSDIGNVRVLNLVYANGADAQDQLTLVPEPSSFELLGLGAVVVFLGRRRFSVMSPKVV